jgi:hypothetical protein
MEISWDLFENSILFSKSAKNLFKKNYESLFLRIFRSHELISKIKYLIQQVLLLPHKLREDATAWNIFIFLKRSEQYKTSFDQKIIEF